MTPACAQKLRAVLKEFLYKLQPEMANTSAWAAGNGDGSENTDYHYAKKKLRQFDGRFRFLSKRLENATVVDPLEQRMIRPQQGVLRHYGHGRRRRWPFKGLHYRRCRRIRWRAAK
jgi:transcription elongation GreA/GreB family factor